MNLIKALLISVLVTGTAVGVVFLTPFLMIIAAFLFVFFAIQYDLKYPDDED